MSVGTKQPNVAFVDLAAQRRRIGDAIERGIARVLEHGQFVLGPEVGELERRLQEFCGAKHCIACANGTDALELVLMAEGMGPGDAVIVPAFTFSATAEAISSVAVRAAPRSTNARLSASSASSPLDSGGTNAFFPAGRFSQQRGS